MTLLILFWISLAFILAAHVGYPLGVMALARVTGRPVRKNEVTRQVSSVVAARTSLDASGTGWPRKGSRSPTGSSPMAPPMSPTTSSVPWPAGTPHALLRRGITPLTFLFVEGIR